MAPATLRRRERLPSREDSTSNLIIKNSPFGHATECSIVAGNGLGPISTEPATAGPWANFDK